MNDLTQGGRHCPRGALFGQRAFSGPGASPALQKIILPGVPGFMFRKAMTSSLSRRIVRLRGSAVGAYCRFDPGAVNRLRELLRAVAA
jgi:hypothetical protein